jgi:hypothetical protein
MSLAGKYLLKRIRKERHLTCSNKEERGKIKGKLKLTE